MNIAYLLILLTLGVAASVVACDKPDQCVADCEAATGSGTSSQCQDHTEAATQFIQENNSCETLLDCVHADGICYQGPLAGPCGGVGLSADADLNAWADLSDDLEQSCECGAPACGSGIMCNDEGTCELFVFSEDHCPSVQRDIATFLAANRSCQTDADCQAVLSTCHVDCCVYVAVNTDTNVEDWQRLDKALANCEKEAPGYCNVVGDCAFPVVCGSQGECVVEP